MMILPIINPWADREAKEDNAKEDTEEQETCRQPTSTGSRDPTIYTIVLHVDMRWIIPATHSQ